MGSVQERANLGGIDSACVLPSSCRALCRVVFRVACLSAALCACSTPQERAAHRQAEVEQMMVEYGPACVRLGYAPATDPWRSCVLQLNARDELRRYPSSPGYYDGWGPGYWGGGGWWRPIW